MKTLYLFFSFLLSIQIGLLGCASTGPQRAPGSPASALWGKPSGASPGSAATAQQATAEAAQKPPVSAESSANLVESGKLIKSAPAHMQTGVIGPKAPETAPEKGLTDQQKQKIVLNFDKADVVEVTNQIFGEYLKFNYVIDPALRGQISLYLDGEYTKQELLQLITRAYNASNIDVVPQKGLYHIQTLQRSPSSNLPVADQLSLKEDKYGLKPVIIIYRLRYLDANQAMNTVKYFLTPGRVIGADPLTNSIIMVEDTSNARTIVEVLKTIDVNLMKEIGMEIVQLKAIPPDVAVQNVEALMSKLDLFKNSKLGTNVALLPLQQLGGVLVMAQNPDFLKTAREWLTTMDLQGQQAGEQVYVYFIENGLARDIANILGQIYGLNVSGGDTGPRERIVSAGRTGSFGQRGTGSTSGMGSFGQGSFGSSTGQRSLGGFSSGGTSSQSPFSQGTSGSSTGTGGFGQSATGQRSFGGTAAGARAGARGATGFSTQGISGAGPGGGGMSTFTGQVAIIPDEVNNALVIKANAADYARIKATIQTLDIVPRAVLIEVMLAEIALTGDFQFGIEWFFKNKGMDIAGYQGKQTTFLNDKRGLSNKDFDPVVNAVAPGFTWLWTTTSDDVAFLIQALSTETRVNVLSNPTLLAMDNQEATITVGGREPILSQQSVSAASENTVVNSIQYEETGIILNVTPHINSGGLVRMEVEQTIRNANKNNVSGIDSPSFTERHVQTSLISQDGKTAVIGGIIQQTDNTGHSGIPFLRKVPLISPLFQSTNKTTARTELIVAITPHVVRQSDNEATREFLRKLKQLKQQIGTGI
jgi:general secretion pathway protein D